MMNAGCHLIAGFLQDQDFVKNAPTSNVFGVYGGQGQEADWSWIYVA